MTRKHPSPEPSAVAAELQRLLSRYGDLLAAQHDALERGMIRRAKRLADSAERVLADALRKDQHLATARRNHPDSAVANEDRLGIAAAYVQNSARRLGDLLACERRRLLNEIGHLDPNGGSIEGTSPTSAPPALVNIRT